MRVLFWVQHLLGSGHLRRTLAIAAACAARGGKVVVASGGMPMPWAPPAGVELRELPWIAAADATFGRLVDASGRDAVEETFRRRRERLAALVDERPPDLLVTEMFPFGRRAFRHEVETLLARARARNPACRIVASVRDVLVTKADPARCTWMLDVCRRWYDRVLVHGDPSVLPFAATFPHAAELGDRVVHTGYVHHGARPAARVRDEVLVSAGGGAVGAALMRAAVAARAHSRLRALRWRLLTGIRLDERTFAALRAAAGEGVAVERHRDDILDLLGRAVVSVSQAGYNTVVESLVARTPMVLVPFAEAGEDEQTIRARRFEELGLAAFVDPEALDPPTLARAVDAMAAREGGAGHAVATDGAERSAELLRTMAGDDADG